MAPIRRISPAKYRNICHEAMKQPLQAVHINNSVISLYTLYLLMCLYIKSWKSRIFKSCLCTWHSQMTHETSLPSLRRHSGKYFNCTLHRCLRNFWRTPKTQVSAGDKPKGWHESIVSLPPRGFWHTADVVQLYESVWLTFVKCRLIHVVGMNHMMMRTIWP